MKVLLALSLLGATLGIGGCAVYADPGGYYYSAPSAAIVVEPSYRYYGHRRHRHWHR
jgi:hypothetical protein